MHLVIHQILLFPDEPRHTVRAINFKPGVVNVLTGTSRRGKSAVGHIIDYCLGSGKCSIPVGPIRDTVGWYGLFLEVEGEFMFVARRAPGEQQSTDDFHLSDGDHLSIPMRPEKNLSRPTFVGKMGKVAGLTDLDLAAGKPTGNYDARASFRDFAAFNFLPQHIVANPQTLFFKADTVDHRDKLRRVFPLALGVVDAEYLLAEHEERDLQRRLEELEYEASRRRKANEAWIAELVGYIARANELGLLAHSVPDSAAPTEELITSLRDALRDIDGGRQMGPSVGSTEGAVSRLNAILDDEGRIARDISDRRRQLQRLLALTNSLREYGTQLRFQYGRVEGAGWFARHLSSTSTCPFCRSPNESIRSDVQALVGAASDLSQLLESTERPPIALEKEETRLRSDIRDLEAQLLVRRRERRELEEASQEASRARQRMSEVFRFVGRVEQALKNLEDASSDSDLAAAISALKEQLGQVQVRLQEANRAARQKSVLARISRLIKPTAQTMQLERRDDTAHLVPNELALTFAGQGGRNDYLWEVGSGENWMGYHIAVLLALHEFFLAVKRCPVPTFLVIDQPTQVYFPARDDAYDRARRDPAAAKEKEGDIERARRIFEALSEGVKRTKGKVQIIVTEHADDFTWGGVPEVHLVENWRGDNYLIPPSWIEKPGKR